MASTPHDAIDERACALDRLAVAIRTRVDSRRVAETRLASFAFSEGPVPGRSGSTATRDDGPVDRRYFVLRALAVLGDPDSVRILDALRGGDRPLEELMGMIEPVIHDRLVAADRVGGLASAGLVGRELESDRVALTPLGEALLDLVADVERRMEASGR